MATPQAKTPEAPDDAALEGGSYEVLRRRLSEQGEVLSKKATKLNTQRQETFGGTPMAIIGNERIRTANNCVPQDMVQVEGKLLFGYNVFIGLRKETTVSDVFALHHFRTGEDGGFDLSEVATEEAPTGLLRDEKFVREFEELYRYYGGARLALLRRTESRLLAVFRTGESQTDLRVFRWGLDAEGHASYIDNRGERDHVFPSSHDFEWKATSREDQVRGSHPHVSILDEVFVEAVGGDLTVKVENNTEEGRGIYSEPVDDPNQGLDDGQIEYAKVGRLILIRVLPYRETKWRHLVFNTRTQQVVRIDGIGQACVSLPEDQGIIFPGGYYLQTGDYRLFDTDTKGLRFKRAIRSPNGEDVLYVFHRARDGHFLLFPYNLVRQEVSNLINCHGFSLFPDGRMIVFRAAGDEPTRVHPVQIWQTPYTSAEFESKRPSDGSFLGRVGNAELVRGISDCFTVCRMVRAEEVNRQTFEDLVVQVQRVLDAYYWLGGAEVDDLAVTLREIQSTAELVIDEYEKVVAMRARAEAALAEADERARTLLRDIRPDTWERIDDFLTAMTHLRTERGHLITVKDVRYVDVARLDALEEEVADAFDRVSEAAVGFLLENDAFAPMRKGLEGLLERIAVVERSVELAELAAELETLAEGLTLLGETVGALDVGDPTARTKILQDVSEVFSLLNRVRATLQNRRQELLGREGRVEFGAQFALFGQTVESALALCDTPDKCDEQLSRVLVALEELESRFSDYDEFALQLTEKREEVYEAFSGRKQQLREQRQRRAANLASAADRIFQGIERRARSFKDLDELNGFFASDPMVLRLRGLVQQLMDLEDPVKADEIGGRLQSARQNAMRAQRDRSELFEDGANVVRFGTHRFNVTTEEIELTLVPRGDGMALHLSGTDFYEALDDPEFEKTRPYWQQQYVSETDEVYRAEFLAAQILFAAEGTRDGLSLGKLHEALGEKGGLLELVRRFAADRYEEGYERGVHDADAARILEKLLGMRETVGLLRFAPSPRALACLYWAFLEDEAERQAVQRRAASLGRLRHAFHHEVALSALGDELGSRVDAFLEAGGVDHGRGDVLLSGRYLAEELTKDHPRFVTSQDAVTLKDALLKHLDGHGMRTAFEEDLAALSGSLRQSLGLVMAWLEGFLASREGEQHAARAEAALEAAVLLLTDGKLDREVSSARTRMEVGGLLGQHRRLTGGTIEVRLEAFLRRLAEFIEARVPAYHAYRRQAAAILERERARLRLDELKPKVLTSFVRNQLINDVYLPLIGGNLAKQLGSAGDDRRTDQSGLLLLISPPGYGKTTLMEYVASTLGLVFVKVNGPSLGHAVTSIDPAEAPNATARQEVDKINLAFEMGNNVLLYLDDIQHTHSELLQKFISLCDAQRRVEGVWKGRTRTYDMRGKKFAVVMAGNPYTEAGERFQLPDMLANRADTYNLGDILDGKETLFAQSYIENALTSNAVLRPLSGRDPADTRRLIRMARGEEVPTSELSHNYSAAELEEILAVLRHLFRAQATLLQVNAEYIRSASQDDKYRTEPPFKLQGSYRNMARIAERIVSAMTPDEVESLVDDHYLGESQTLTTGAEHNLLKLAEMRGRIDEAQAARWDEIKRGFARHQVMGGSDEDPAVRALGQLAMLTEQVGGLRDAVLEAAARATAEAEAAAAREAAEAAKAKRAGGEASAAAKALAAAQAEAAKVQAEAQAKMLEALGPRLESLEKALTNVAKVAAKSAKAALDAAATGAGVADGASGPAAGAAGAPAMPDLGPVLEKLGETLAAVAGRPVHVQLPVGAFAAPAVAAAPPTTPPSPPAKGKGKKKAVEAPASEAVPPPLPAAGAYAPPPGPPGFAHQLKLIQDALMPLRQLSRHQLRDGGEGKVAAMHVWRQVNEALQVVQAAALHARDAG
jgi:hypothetical protein